MPFIVKMLLGAVFAVSAVAKLIAIDNFEIYVYSFGWLSLPAAFIISRLLIAVELLIAIGLLSNLCSRLTTVSTLLALLAFSLFLGIAALGGRTDNCHCFGDLIELNPLHSLIKNALLILMTLVAMKAREWSWHPWWWLWPIVAAVPVATVFIVSPPDNWMFRTEHEPCNQAMLQRHLEQSDGLLRDIAQGDKKLLAFYSPSCHFCQLAATKIGTLQQRYGIADTLFVNIFPVTDTSRYDTFYLKTQSPRYRQVNLPPDTFLHITYGQFPLILLMEGDSIQATYNYRTIDEKAIVWEMKNEK